MDRKITEHWRLAQGPRHGSSTPQSIGELLVEPGGLSLPHQVGQYLSGSDLAGWMASHRRMPQMTRPLTLSQVKSVARCWDAEAPASSKMADACRAKLARDAARFVAEVLWAPARPLATVGIRDPTTGERTYERLVSHPHPTSLVLRGNGLTLLFHDATWPYAAILKFAGRVLPRAAEAAIAEAFLQLRAAARATTQTPPESLPASQDAPTGDERRYDIRQAENDMADRQLELALLVELLELAIPFADAIHLRNASYLYPDYLDAHPRARVISYVYDGDVPLLGIPLEMQEDMPSLDYVPLPPWMNARAR